MEERHVQVSQLQFNAHFREWEAEGWAERYGSRVRWTAWRAHERWEVDVPAGQWSRDEVALGELVGAQPALGDDVRLLLAGYGK